MLAGSCMEAAMVCPSWSGVQLGACMHAVSESWRRSCEDSCLEGQTAPRCGVHHSESWLINITVAICKAHAFKPVSSGPRLSAGPYHSALPVSKVQQAGKCTVSCLGAQPGSSFRSRFHGSSYACRLAARQQRLRPVLNVRKRPALRGSTSSCEPLQACCVMHPQQSVMMHCHLAIGQGTACSVHVMMAKGTGHQTLACLYIRVCT